MLMLLLAVISSAIAAYYYPWPELVETDAEVGKPLFENYAADQVRGIDIVGFDSENGTLDRIKLVRSGEKWIIPARQNFIATNAPLIGEVINSLNDRTIYEVMSENQEDHINFGVVDPAEFTADMNTASLGRRLVLTDRNNKVIASLIVGSPVKNNPSRRYVRAPGKPRVYLIDFNEQILTTQFSNWVSPDALQLTPSERGPGQQLKSAVIDDYRLSRGKDKTVRRDPVYRATLVPVGQRIQVQSLLVADSSDPAEWRKLATTPEQQTKLTGSIRGLISLFPDDVRRTEKEIASALENPSADTSPTIFKGLEPFGFYLDGFQAGRWVFKAEHGDVSVNTEAGVIMTVLVGKVGGANSRRKGKLNYFVMINAGVNNDLLAEPIRPDDLPDDESAENKEFRRRYEAWQQTVQAAERKAAEINAIHGDWIYLISEEIIDILQPQIPLPAIEPGPPSNNGEANETVDADAAAQELDDGSENR